MNKNSARVSAPSGLRAMLAALSLRVKSGPMAGYAWRLTSGGKLFRVLEGRYEVDQTQAFVDMIKPGDCVFDVGAHVGWYSLLSARLVGDSGKVLAFEANPRNYWYLDRHIRQNGVAGTVEAAHLGIADKRGNLYFQGGTGTGTGRLAETGEVRVPAKSIDEIVAERNCTPTHIKIDVEGGEMAVLEGASETLSRHKPVLFLSTHGADIKAQCMDYLAEKGYTFRPMGEKVLDQVADFICC